MPTGFSVETKTSKQGIYTVPELPPGSYTLKVSAPGLNGASVEIELPLGSRVRQDFTLGGDAMPSVFLDQQTQQQVISHSQIVNLPNLTRDVFQFTQLAGNLSDAGLGTRGAGFAMNGLRESSVDIRVDGAMNRNEFTSGIGQLLPLDSVQELSVITSGFTSQFGRAAAGIVSVTTRTGTNELHGSAYEFNRVSQLASNTYQNNANGLKQPDFNRNQFGYAAGGPILRNRLFLFSSFEGTLVRSDSTNYAWIPTADLISRTASNTQSFFQTLGQVRPSAHTIGLVSLNDLTALYGRNPCTGLACATLPSTLPLFNHVAYSAPSDAGGGFPQNTWQALERVDYNLSDRMRIYGRYSLYKEDDPAGVLSSSPYSNYDLGQSQLNNSFLASAARNWGPKWISQTTVEFNRLTIVQQGLTSRGLVPTMYANPLAPVTIGSDNIAFPGYNPFSPGSGGAFGGPQNFLEVGQSVSWLKGKHAVRFGGSYDYIRDNRTDAAYQTAIDSLSSSGGIGTALNGLLSGRFAQIEVAVNPQGKFPCSGGTVTSACSLTLPVSAPDFSRSNRYQDGALYIHDFWKVSRRLTVNGGVRWEHYGVQHNKNSRLDSNWYSPGAGFADANLGAYLRNGGLQLAPSSSMGQLYQSDWKDFAPRVGVAWDVFGDGRTSLRGGYGIGYERNFGNVTFNVIQNLPNYAVVDVPGPVSTSNYGPLSATGTLTLPQVGARIIDPQIKTAHAHTWNASIQHQFTRNIAYAAEYSGSKGVDLYTVSYPNQYGFGNFALGDRCTGAGDCTSQPNANYAETIGYRGNQGFSIYHGLNNRLTLNNFLNRGLALTVNYTWSHAIDNMSSSLFETGGQGVASQFGNQNITTNNGLFVTGLLDPYHPNLDRGNADFDVRHRVALSGIWTLPVLRGGRWRRATEGWSLSPVFTARSGQPFSVFDSSAQTLDLSTPRATFNGKVPHQRNSFVASTTPGVFHIIRFSEASVMSEPNLLTPASKWPSNLSGRNAFRAPGFWNLDVGIYKETKITDRFSVQLRGELFNVFNHANLYLIGASADVSRSDNVDACYGCTGSSYDRRQVQLAAKFTF